MNISDGTVGTDFEFTSTTGVPGKIHDMISKKKKALVNEKFFQNMNFFS